VSWLYSRVLVEAYSGGISSAGERSAPSSAIPMPQAYWSPGKTTDVCPPFRSGMMCEPLTASLGEELLTLYRADFHARIYPQPVEEQVSTENDLGCGGKWRESSVRFDPVTFSWKTHRLLFHAVLPESSVILPRWGMMRDGVCWERMTSVRLTNATESGYWPAPVADGDRRTNYAQGGTSLGYAVRNWPTPRACDHKGARTATACTARRVALRQANLPEAVMESMRWATPTSRDWKSGKVSEETMRRNSRPLSDQIGGTLNPNWVEWLMGWPIGWTDCAASGTAKYRQWFNSLGKP
jgi:hypothetical protein